LAQPDWQRFFRFCTGVKPASPRAFFIQTLPAKQMIRTADAFGREWYFKQKTFAPVFYNSASYLFLASRQNKKK
jgi:hypothetical protein